MVLYKLHLDESLSNTRRTFMTFLHFFLLLCAVTALSYSIMGGCLIYFGAKHSFQNDCMPGMEA